MWDITLHFSQKTVHNLRNVMLLNKYWQNVLMFRINFDLGMPPLKLPSGSSLEYVRSWDIGQKFCIKVRQMPVDRTNNCDVREIILSYNMFMICL